MNANLTRAGIWLFAAAMVAVTVGVGVGSVVIVMLGTCLVLALTISYGATVPAALALDRRFIETHLSEVDSAAEDRHAGHVVGDTVEAELTFANGSGVPLFGVTLEPYGADELGVEGRLELAAVPARTSAPRTLEFRAERSGRWMLQGFDISITDPFGLVEIRDYTPCNFAFEFYPRVGRLARKPKDRDVEKMPKRRREGSRRAMLTSGTEIQELREYQPGDPLRHVAWKATARIQKLISRDFENEISSATTVLLDISGSMRGGAWRGQKLEHGIELTAGLADQLVGRRNRVGLLTFDDKVYGYLKPASSRTQYFRILHHLVGLNSIVDPVLTELEAPQLRKLVVDYLLVQERLDFRDGENDDSVDDELLERWIRSQLEQERELYHSPVLEEGVVDSEQSVLREFVQLRGLPVPYRVESRLGPKGRGMAQALERIVREASESQYLVAVSDLCSVSNFETLDRGLSLARREGHRIRFVVPFTPAYYLERGEASEKRNILLELFTASEREDRLEAVEFLESRGIDVQFVGGDHHRPDDSGELPAAE